MAAALGLSKDRGEIVQRIEDGQAAAKAGLKRGDVVTKINGKEITPQQTLSYIVANIKPGTRVPIEVIREGKALSLSAVIGTRPPERSEENTHEIQSLMRNSYTGLHAKEKKIKKKTKL